MKTNIALVRNIKYVFGNIWRWDREVLVFVTLQAVIGVMLPAFGIYLPKLVIDMVTNHASLSQLVIILSGFTLLMAAANFIHRYAISNVNTSAMSNRMQYQLLRNGKLMDCDYAFIEGTEGQSLHRQLNNAVMQERSGPQIIVRLLPEFVAGVLGFMLYGSLLTFLNPIVLMLLILTSLINYAVLNRATRCRESFREEYSTIMDKFTYFNFKVADFASAKDIRLYNMKPWFMSMIDALLRQDRQRLVKIARFEFAYNISDAVVLLVRDGAAYAFLIWYVLTGQIGVSDFVLYIGAVTGFGTFVNMIVNNYIELVRGSHDIDAIRTFLEKPDKSNRGAGKSLPTASDLPISVEFSHVYFRYEPDGRYVLEDFCLRIEKGERLAIVGANGAGKTTVVKLLCGFYMPESGEILINGTPISRYNRDDLYTLFSAVFQDMLVMPLSIAHNIAMNNSIDRERVRKCISDAGLSARLPDIDAQLTKIADPNGIELSGGEQQRLILARALYKGAAVLALDEPTASLDPIAESDLYMKYHGFSENKTSIYISHRLASTSFCDRVAYIEDGRVAELGTHRELMEQNGGYRRMFDIQSYYYRDGLSECEQGEVAV